MRGLVEFYADFRTTPPAAHTVAVCAAEACQAAGSRALTRALEERLEVELGRISADGCGGPRARLLPGPVCPGAGTDGGRSARGRCRPRARPRHRRGEAMTDRTFVPHESVADALGAAEIARLTRRRRRRRDAHRLSRPAVGRAHGRDRARRATHGLRTGEPRRDRQHSTADAWVTWTSSCAGRPA